MSPPSNRADILNRKTESTVSLASTPTSTASRTTCNRSSAFLNHQLISPPAPARARSQVHEVDSRCSSTTSERLITQTQTTSATRVAVNLSSSAMHTGAPCPPPTSTGSSNQIRSYKRHSPWGRSNSLTRQCSRDKIHLHQLNLCSVQHLEQLNQWKTAQNVVS